jgi:hypothetical protein
MKTNIMLLLYGVIFVTTLLGCASKQTKPDSKQEFHQGSPVDIPTGVDEKLIWSSEAQRPGWTLTEPDAVDGVMFFVGLSGNLATEKSSRDDAQRAAINNVVAYMGTLVKDKFERASVSFGLESSVVDPTASARQFEKQLAVNVARRTKTKHWYIEKWQTPTGIAYRTFALTQVPQQEVERSFKDMARDMARKAEQDAKQESDIRAKEQAEKAAEFWRQMEEQGLAE